MKLHLPLLLLAALLSAMSYSPVYAAQEDVTEAVSPYQITENPITTPITLEGQDYTDETFTIEGGGEVDMTLSTTRITGNSTITLSDSGVFSMRAGVLGYGEGSQLNVTIDSSSSFNITGGTVASAGAAVSFTVNTDGSLEVSGANMATGAGASTTINVAGGSFTQRSGSIGSAADSTVTITVTEGGSVTQAGNVAYASGSTANITVTNGTYTLTSTGHIGEVGGHAVIRVEQGGVFNSSGSISARNTGHTEITVDGGIFNNSGAVLSNMNTYGSLTIENGGTFNQTGGSVAAGSIAEQGVTISVDADSFYNLSSGSFGSRTNDREVSVTIAGSFTQTGGDVGVFITNMTLDVQEGGSYAMSGGSLGNSGGTFNLTVQEGGSMALSGSGQIIGMVQISVAADGSFIQSGGVIQGMAQNAIHITLGDSKSEDEEASYSMTDGDIAGNVLVTVNSDGAFTMSGNAEIGGNTEVVVVGGSFSQTGGVFGGKATLTLSDGASYTLSDSGEFSAAGITASGEETSVTQNGGSMQTSLTLEDGATFTQNGGTFSGSITASGEETTVTQTEGGSITDAVITLTDGATFTQSGSVIGDIRVSGDGSCYTQESGTIGSGSGITLSDGGSFVQNGGVIFADVTLDDATASFTQKGTLNGSVTLNGGATFTQEASGGITGDVTVNNGTFTQSAGSIGGNVTVNGASSAFAQDGTIGGDVTVSNGGEFTGNEDSIIQGSLTVDNASFTQKGTVGQDVTVQNGGTLTQEKSAVVSGSVTVSGSGSSFTQQGSIGGGVSLQSGSYTQQSGDITGAVEVQGGTYDQQGGSISGGLTLVEGTLTQGDGASIRGGVTMQGGVFEQSGAVTGNVSVSGGSYTMKGASASLTGDVSVSGASFTQEEGSITGAVDVENGMFTQSGGSITGDVSVAGGSFAQSGAVTGNVSLSDSSSYMLAENGALSGGKLSMSGASSFTMTGGTLSSESVEVLSGTVTISGGTVQNSTITAAAGSSVTVSGGDVQAGSTVSLTDATLTLAEGATMAAAVEMNGTQAVYDLGGVVATGAITLKGGNLENAGSYNGSITIDTAADYNAKINLGGVSADKVSSIYMRSAEALLTGLQAGSTLTFSGTDSTMVVGTNTSTTKISSGTDCLISFEGGNGTVSFGENATLTLNFTSDLLVEAAAKELEGVMTIHITNGTLSAEEKNFVFGSGFADYVTFYSVENGDLKLTIDVDGIWISSLDGSEVTSGTEISQDTMVVVDVDMTIHLTSGENEVTLNHLIGDGSSVGNLDIIADQDQTITLNNDTDGNTVYNGNITVSGDAVGETTLQKTGEGSLTLGGVLTTEGTLDVQEGTLVLNSAGNTVAQLEMGDDAELSIVGDLTLKDGVSSLHTGSITGGGELIVDGGEVDFGTVTVQANLTVKDAEVTQGGLITGDVLVTGVSTFYHNADIDGSVTLGMGANLSSNKDADISGSVTILAEAENTQVMLQGEIGQDATISGKGSRIDGVTKVGGNVEISGEGASLTGDDAEIDGSVTLTGAGAKVEGVTNIGGNVTVSGDTASLDASGTITGTVTLSGANSSATAAGITGDVSITGTSSTLTVTGTTLSGDILLNGAGAMLDLNNQTISNAGSLTINDGKLGNASNYTGDVHINTSSSFSDASLNLGGLNAENVKSIKTASDISITGLATGSTLTLTGKDNMLTVGLKHVGLDGAAAAEQLIQFENGSGSITFNDAAVMLQFTEELMSSFINGELKLAVTNGSITDLTGISDDAEILEWLRTHFLLATGSGLEFAFFSGEEGENTIIITAGASNVWRTSDMVSKVTEIDAFDDYTKVIIDRTTKVTVAAEQGDDHMILRQLEGSDNLTITNTGSEDLTVELRNESFFNANGEQQSWGATVYNGNIKASGGVDFEKTGNDTLMLNGNLSTDGDVDVKGGSLIINGADNTADSIHLTPEDPGADPGALVVNGSLTLSGESDLSADEGSISGAGLIIVEDSLTIGENVSLNGPAILLDAEDSALDVSETKNASIGGLGGSGTLTIGDGGLTVTGGQGVFTGTMEGKGALALTGDAQLTIAGAGNEAYDLINSRKSVLTLSSDAARYRSIYSDGLLRITPQGSGVDGAPMGHVSVTEDILLFAGSSTEFVINFDSTKGVNGQDAILSGDARALLESGCTIIVNGIGSGMNVPGELELTLIDAQGGIWSSLNDIIRIDADATPGDRIADDTVLTNVTLSGLFNVYYQNAVVTVEDGTKVILRALPRTSNVFDEAARSFNSSAGSFLLWSIAQSNFDPDTHPTLAAAMGSIADMIVNGQTALASQTMAAVAGSTVPALGAAQHAAMREQLQRTRNHAFLAEGYETHTWIEATGSYAKMSSSGDETGYTLNSWGATVGTETSLSKKVSLGLSLTALYGDLEANAAESAEGKLDSYYLSLALHVREEKWTHTVVLTGGLYNGELNRTVSYGAGSYHTTGSTDGQGFAALYELTYDIPLAENKSSILQPLLNVSVVSTSMKGYDESGADGASLRVGKQSWTTTTLGVGARWLGQVGTALFGKAAQAELRANVAFDAGDRRGENGVALMANPAFTAKVRSAEVGQVGFQFGAGIALPVSENTRIYVNGNADLRSGSSSWNVNAGVSLTF